MSVNHKRNLKTKTQHKKRYSFEKKKIENKQTKTDPIKMINARSEGKCKNGDKRKAKNVT